MSSQLGSGNMVLTSRLGRVCVCMCVCVCVCVCMYVCHLRHQSDRSGPPPSSWDLSHRHIPGIHQSGLLKNESQGIARGVDLVYQLLLVRQFISVYQLLVIDILKDISLSSFDCKKFCEERFLVAKVIKKKRFFE